VKDEDAVTCWMKTYKTTVESLGVTFPVDNQVDFYKYLDQILASPFARSLKSQMLYEDGKIKFMMISGKTTVA
jgi:hypothetical protein